MADVDGVGPVIVPVSGVYAAYFAELDQCGAVDTPEGQTMLALASALDDRAGVINLAVTARTLLAARAEWRKTLSSAEGTPYDELSRRRVARGAEAPRRAGTGRG